MVRTDWPLISRAVPLILLLMITATAGSLAADKPGLDVEAFTLADGTDLFRSAKKSIKGLLTPVRGGGQPFTVRQKQTYRRLKTGNMPIQWVLNDLETGKVIDKSDNSGDIFFGASSSKVFVAAALLDKQEGRLTREQFDLMVRMIVKSSNIAWRELQRQAGDDGTDDSGRQTVAAFTNKMGYTGINGFQGTWTRKDGTKVHGNELNTRMLAAFAFDTYHRKYPGAGILWNIMQATKTGRNKVNKYTPNHVYVGGKTGTYHGPNVSPKTVKLSTIKARNHLAILKVRDRYYGCAILSNGGTDEDVAVLAGGLMREWLDVGETL